MLLTHPDPTTRRSRDRDHTPGARRPASGISFPDAHNAARTADLIKRNLCDAAVSAPDSLALRRPLAIRENAIPTGLPVTPELNDAFAYAAALDALAATDLTDAENDALIAVGELLGGWSAGGFVADLRAALVDLKTQAMDAASPRDSRAWLRQTIESGQRGCAENWMRDAMRIMAECVA